MILKADDIAKKLRAAEAEIEEDPLIITPLPDIESLEESGSASIDLRLGTWFLTLRRARMKSIDIDPDPTISATPNQYTKSHFVPFGKEFILHPRSFVLGITLEWIRLPRDLAAILTGKSSWGRRGLIIATATGVHPGFTGCLTLEITNLGEIPIVIKPGIEICQLFIHTLTSASQFADTSAFSMKRKPTFGHIKIDEFCRKLSID